MLAEPTVFGVGGQGLTPPLSSGVSAVGGPPDHERENDMKKMAALAALLLALTACAETTDTTVADETTATTVADETTATTVADETTDEATDEAEDTTATTAG